MRPFLLQRQCFDGNREVETLVNVGITNVEGMALDWVSNNLYFVDGGLHQIEVIRTDINHWGRMRRTILNDTILDNPRGIAVHPIKG